MRKVILVLTIILSLVLFDVTCYAAPATTTAIPDSISYNGFLANGSSIYSNPETNSPVVSPMAVREYRYVPGYESLVGEMSIIYEFAYVYGTSIAFIEGTSVIYKLSKTKEVTKQNSWNINGQLSGDFNIGVVKANLEVSGGYSNSATVTLTTHEEWELKFPNYGVYDVKWYMRGHEYTAQCGSTILSTGADNGNFYYYTLGKVIFATDETHISIISINM